MLRFLLAAACLITAAAVPAQNGVAGTGRWAEGPGGQGAFFREGDRLGIRAQGEDNFVWRSPEVKILPGKAYRFRFRAKGEGSGLVVSGLPQANHDFNTPADWQTFSFAFRAPESGDPYMRIGEWHARGSLLFEKPEMYPVKTAHRQWGSLTLGEGESLQKGQYTDRHPLGWAGTTVHRSLYRQNTYFNTNRWSFGPSGEVVYRHQLPFEMKSGKVTVNINLYGAGALTVSASRDGQNWTEAARLSRMGDGEAALPASLFPAKEIYVRLQAEGGDANIQADQYAFQAAVDYAGPARRGETALIEERLSSGDVDLSWNPETRRWALRWQNRYPSARPLAISLAVNGKPVSVIRKTAAGGKAISAAFPAPALPVGQYSIEVTVASGQQTLHTSQVDIRQTVIGESDYGYPLASGNKSLSAWWCEGAWKVGRDRGVPTGKASQAVRIEAARGEYEPAQVVLNARQQGIVLTGAQVSDLVGKGGRIPARQVALHEVATVTVEHPSDSLGDAGEYPDPLPLLKTPLALPARRNQALWVLVHVPGSAAAGDYRGTLTLCTNRGNLDIPLQVHVFDFAIPKETHLRSGFGADNGGIKTYYKLDTPEQERRMWDLYMKSFADHRISPYSFFPYGPVQVTFEGEGDARQVKVGFTAFDREAERYLDRLGLTAFSLPVQGLGSGTFYDRTPGEFGGFKAGDPNYERLMGDYLRQLESHLKEKGWLDKAYIYWFDEPDPKDYPFVVEMNERIHRYAPGLRRLLTEQPEKDLLGHVEIWCGLTPEWSKKTVAERRQAGEEVWWYICTGPRAPYIGLFIEHPAVEMRLWPWQSWQYGVQGILIWTTTWWTSEIAFPNSLQNPWENPMSYVSGYGTPVGTKAFWGNGDGRFFYPPRRDPNKAGDPVIEPPTPSIRWENLRDGVEDYEYFWLLGSEIKRLQGRADASLLDQAESLLEVPPAISQDLTHFTFDPRPLMAHRRKVAAMIERLQGMR